MLLCPGLPPAPRAEAEQEVSKTEEGGASAKDGEQPPSVPDNAVERTARVFLQCCPAIWDGVVTFG